MPTVEIEIEVFCANCGEGLCNVSKAGTTRHRGQPYISVEPCKHCMGKEYDRGLSDAEKEG